MKYEKCLICDKIKITKSEKISKYCKSCSNKKRHEGKTKKQYIPKNKHNLNKIKCILCDFKSVCLISHLYWKHKITGKEYTEKFGVPFQSSIDDEDTKNIITKIRKKASPRCIEYWIEKGLTEQEAKIKVSESQTTFSYEKCIEKYGAVEGEKIFIERQKKWQSSLSNLDLEEINRKKVYTLTNIINENKETWIEVYTKRKDKKHLIEVIKKYPTLEVFIKEAYKDISWKKIKRLIYKIKFIREYYNINKDNEDSIYYSCFSFLENKPKRIYGVSYGVNIFYNGFMFRSFGELEIAVFLFDKQIKFCYDKKYPNLPDDLNIRYDFYLPDLEYYIEYIGLAKRQTIDSKIVNKYKERLDRKKDFICNGNISCLVSFDIDEIKNKILELVNEKKNNNKECV